MTGPAPDLNLIEARLRQALAAQPNDPFSLTQLAAVLASTGRLQEAELRVKEACALAPAQPQPLFTYGMILRSLNRLPEAEAAFTRAIERGPNSGDTWLARGTVRMEQRRFESAIADFTEAAGKIQDPFPAYAYKSNALRLIGRLPEALAAIDRALQIAPFSADARRARAMVLGAMKRHPESLAEIESAIGLAPNDPENWAAKGDLSRQAARHADAIASFEKALAINPARPDIEEFLIVTRRAACDWLHFDQDAARFATLARDPSYPIHPYGLISFDISSADQLRAARKYAQSRVPPLLDVAPVFARPRPDEPIRVAYLSSDFRDHAVSALLVGVIENHDRSRFAVTAISTGRNDGSALRARVEAAFDRFVDASTLSDDAIAREIQAQKTDILVDLNGLSGDARPGVLAYRSAPVQATFLGYPGTTGLPFLDYMIADRIVVPPSDRANFSEPIVYLPNAYQPNDDKSVVGSPPTRAELGLADEAFVFCCFNAPYKITPSTFQRWLRILLAAPDSVLWLVSGNAAAQTNLQREAERGGVAPDRIVFAPFAQRPEHLGRLSQADLFLDTTPYSAHTTASDALWAGVPVLTTPGDTFASRVPASLLHAVGLPELIPSTPGAYEALAIELAADRTRLDALKRKLAANVRTAPLFDTKRFARDLEKALAAMHDRRLHGLPPADISVPLN